MAKTKLKSLAERKAFARKELENLRTDLIVEVNTPREIEKKAKSKFQCDEIGKKEFADLDEHNVDMLQRKYPKEWKAMTSCMNKEWAYQEHLKNQLKSDLKKKPTKEQLEYMKGEDIQITNEIERWGGEKGNFGLLVDSTYYDIMNEDSSMPNTWLKRVDTFRNKIDSQKCFMHSLGHPSAHEIVCLTDKEIEQDKQAEKTRNILRPKIDKLAVERDEAEKRNDTKRLSEIRKEFEELRHEFEEGNKYSSDKYLRKEYRPFGKYTSNED